MPVPGQGGVARSGCTAVAGHSSVGEDVLDGGSGSAVAVEHLFWLDHDVREAAFGEYPSVGSDAPQSHDYLHAAQGL